MPPDPPRKQVPLALAIGRLRRPQCSRTNLPLFHLDFQFFNLHLPVLPKSGLAALPPTLLGINSQRQFEISKPNIMQTFKNLLLQKYRAEFFDLAHK